MTRVVSKQLLPVYDKPMIYYPLSTLMLAGIRDILVISTPQDLPRFEQLLGDGSQWGMRISYAVQPSPRARAGVRHRRASSSATSRVALVLGDNIFYGSGFSEPAAARRASARAAPRSSATTSATRSATASSSSTPTAGCVGSRRSRRRRSRTTPSPACTSTTTTCVDIAAALQPSARGELEITDVNRRVSRAAARCDVRAPRARHGLARHRDARVAARGVAASSRRIEKRQGLKVACPEEIAWRMGFIDEAQLRAVAEPLGRTRTASTCSTSWTAGRCA